MAEELESSLERFFRERVRLLGGYTVKLAPTEAGIPDRMAIFPGGRIYLVELKAIGGQLSPIQRVLHDRLADRYGVRVTVLTGRNDIIAWLRRVVSADDPVNKPGRPPLARVQ